MSDRRFPVMQQQGQYKAKRGIKSIPWSVAERAHLRYSKLSTQALERIAERGGFAEHELDEFAPGWDYEARTIDTEADNQRLRAALTFIKEYLENHPQQDRLRGFGDVIYSRTCDALEGK